VAIPLQTPLHVVAVEAIVEEDAMLVEAGVHMRHEEVVVVRTAHLIVPATMVASHDLKGDVRSGSKKVILLINVGTGLMKIMCLMRDMSPLLTLPPCPTMLTQTGTLIPGQQITSRVSWRNSL